MVGPKWNALAFEFGKPLLFVLHSKATHLCHSYPNQDLTKQPWKRNTSVLYETQPEAASKLGWLKCHKCIQNEWWPPLRPRLSRGLGDLRAYKMRRS